MSIKEKYLEILDIKNKEAVKSGRNPEDVTLMAVTKTRTVDEINQVIDAGATDIGENKVQELLEKYEKVDPVRWHLIGHLQTNKVKNIIEKVVMIHSVDSLRLAKEIDKRAGNSGIKMDILIEVNSAMEDTKSGVTWDELKDLTYRIVESCANIRVCGLMIIPPPTEDMEDSAVYFKEAKSRFDDMQKWELDVDRFAPTVLSMGMSGDFPVAVREGSTIVRVGSGIFGPRNYR